MKYLSNWRILKLSSGVITSLTNVYTVVHLAMTPMIFDSWSNLQKGLFQVEWGHFQNYGNFDRNHLNPLKYAICMLKICLCYPTPKPFFRGKFWLFINWTSKLRVCSRSGSVKFFCSPSGLFDSRGQIETKCESSRMPPLLKQWSTYSTPPVSTKPSIKPIRLAECRIRADHVSSLDILFLSGFFVGEPFFGKSEKCHSFDE